MTREERTKSAFDYARDSSKQMMALATGTITLTITFMHDFVVAASPELKWCMVASWVLLLVSVSSGQVCLLGLTGILGSERDPPPKLTIYAASIKWPAVFQTVTFLLGLLLATAFAISSVG